MPKAQKHCKLHDFYAWTAPKKHENIHQKATKNRPTRTSKTHLRIYPLFSHPEPPKTWKPQHPEGFSKRSAAPARPRVAKAMRLATPRNGEALPEWANALVPPTPFFCHRAGELLCAGSCNTPCFCCGCVRWSRGDIGKSWLWWWPHRSLRLAQRCSAGVCHALLSLPFWPMKLWWSSEQSQRGRSGWFWQHTWPGQPCNSFESRNRSSLHGLRNRSHLLWRPTAARARLVLAAGPTSLLGLVLAVLAQEGHSLGWGAFGSCSEGFRVVRVLRALRLLRRG